MNSRLTILLIPILIGIVFSKDIPIAVNDLEGNGLTETEISIISDRLRSELSQVGTFSVMERGEMNAILQEMEFQMSGACDDASCMVEVGQILGVQKIVAGSTGKLGDFYTISLRIIDVATGRIEASASYDYTGEISEFVSTGLKIAARKIAGEDTAGVVNSNNSESDTSEQLSQLIITSIPTGANLAIDDSIVGNTPYNGSLLPGRYSLSFSFTGYDDLDKRITLNEGLNLTKQFELNKTEERRRGRITRIVSGSISALALAGGIVMNNKMSEYDSDAALLYSDAVQNGTGVADNENYTTAKSNAESSETKRNVLYAISGVTVTVFAVSFAF